MMMMMRSEMVSPAKAPRDLHPLPPSYPFPLFHITTPRFFLFLFLFPYSSLNRSTPPNPFSFRRPEIAIVQVYVRSSCLASYLAAGEAR